MFVLVLTCSGQDEMTLCRDMDFFLLYGLSFQSRRERHIQHNICSVLKKLQEREISIKPGYKQHMENKSPLSKVEEEGELRGHLSQMAEKT